MRFLGSIKSRVLKSGPFAPVHVGLWVRMRYFEKYFATKHERYLPKKARVLDAGCGRGRYGEKLAGISDSYSIIGYDISEQKEWEQLRRDNLNFSIKDLHAFDEKEAFDAIVSVDSLEHIPGNKTIIQKFYNALKKGGILYLAMPSIQQEMFIFPKSWFQKIYEWEAIEHIGEQYTLDELKKVLQKAGFRVECSRYTFTFFGKLAWEIEFLLSEHSPKIRILLMPLIKLFGLLDIYLSVGTGNNLILARK